MQEGKVKIADGLPQTRAKLNHFLSEIKLCDPYTKIKTLGDAIEFAIEQAEKVPSLEKENKELGAKVWEEQHDKGLLLEDNQKLKLRIKELEKKIEELEKENESLNEEIRNDNEYISTNSGYLMRD